VVSFGQTYTNGTPNSFFGAAQLAPGSKGHAYPPPYYQSQYAIAAGLSQSHGKSSYAVAMNLRPQIHRLFPQRALQLHRTSAPALLPKSGTETRFFSSTSIRSNSNESQKPLVGVQAALQGSPKPSRTIFDEFSLKGRVSVVTGGKQGIGLELAMALAEAGSSVYCLDLPSSPGEDFEKTAEYVSKLSNADGNPGSLKYFSADVTKQDNIWRAVEEIASKEGRMDVAIANAGILRNADCLEYKDVEFQKLMDVNVNGVLYTAQAAGRQMARFNMPGSIIVIASMSGSVTNLVCDQIIRYSWLCSDSVFKSEESG
jgi:hypothetical protein